MNKNKFLTSARTKKNVDSDLYTFLLIADSPGYRMKSYGPTSLITFKNKKLIDIQIEAIKKSFKNFEIIICGGFDIDKIYKYIKNNYKNLNIRIVENQLFNNSNSCESMRLGLNNTNNDKIYIIDGCLLIYSDLFNCNQKKSFVYIEENPCENLEVGINLDEENKIEQFAFGGSKIWSEILFLGDKDILEYVRKTVHNIDFKNKFIFESLNEVIKNNYDLSYVINKTPIKKINNIKTYHGIKEVI